MNIATAEFPRQSLAPAAEEAWPYYAQDEIDAVTAVLRSGKVNQWTGTTVREFEAACDAKFGGGQGSRWPTGRLRSNLR